jgi:hypothetical protein
MTVIALLPMSRRSASMVMVSLGHAQAGPKICHSRLREPITAG